MITPEDDSCIALVEALVEDAIARQQERHAQEDCAKAIKPVIISCYPSFGPFAAAGKAALDAAIARGHVIVNRP